MFNYLGANLCSIIQNEWSYSLLHQIVFAKMIQETSLNFEDPIEPKEVNQE